MARLLPKSKKLPQTATCDSTGSYISACYMSTMTDSENFAGNIIVSLASLPDFLRQPILKKRMNEFFVMSHDEKHEIITNALRAGPEVGYFRLEKLLRTWLDVLVTLPEAQRTEMISMYVKEAARRPSDIIAFNLDAMFGIFLTLGADHREAIAASVRQAVDGLDARETRIFRLVVPDVARSNMGIP